MDGRSFVATSFRTVGRWVSDVHADALCKEDAQFRAGQCEIYATMTTEGLEFVDDRRPQMPSADLFSSILSRSISQSSAPESIGIL